MDITALPSLYSTALTAEAFRQAADRHPTVNRFVVNNDIPSVVPNHISFRLMPFRFIFGKNQQEIDENKRTLTNFKNALIEQYGEKITAYACPTLESRIQKGTRLDAATIKQVLNDADLLNSLFDQEDVAPFLEEAVRADADALHARKKANDLRDSAERTEADARVYEQNCDSLIKEVDQIFDQKLADRKKELHARAEAARKEGSSIDISGQDIYDVIRDPQNDREMRDLLRLKNTWFAWAHGMAFEGHADEMDTQTLEFFENQVSSLTPQQGDRIVVDKNDATIKAAPRGFFGKTFQWITGRGDREMEENRKTVRHFQLALEAKYGPVIAQYAFPTAASRIERGSRLDKAAVEKALRLANYAEATLDSMGDPICDALDAYGKAATMKHDANSLHLDAKRAAVDAVKANRDAGAAYEKADEAVLQFLTKKAAEGKTHVSIKSQQEARELWFDKAKERFAPGHSLPVAQPVDPSDAPSAPLLEVEAHVITTPSASPVEKK